MVVLGDAVAFAAGDFRRVLVVAAGLFAIFEAVWFMARYNHVRWEDSPTGRITMLLTFAGVTIATAAVIRVTSWVWVADLLIVPGLLLWGWGQWLRNRQLTIVQAAHRARPVQLDAPLDLPPRDATRQDPDPA